MMCCTLICERLLFPFFLCYKYVSFAFVSSLDGPAECFLLVVLLQMLLQMRLQMLLYDYRWTCGMRWQLNRAKKWSLPEPATGSWPG